MPHLQRAGKVDYRTPRTFWTRIPQKEEPVLRGVHCIGTWLSLPQFRVIGQVLGS